MSYQSPFGKAFGNIGTLIANTLQQYQQGQAQQDQELAKEKQARADQINTLLQNPNMPVVNKQQLQALLGRINGAKDLNELNNLQSQYQNNLDAQNPTLSGVFGSGPLQTPEQTVGSAVSAGAVGQQSRQELDAVRQSTFGLLTPILQNASLDPKAKQEMVAKVLSGVPDGALYAGDYSLIAGAANFSDPNLLKKAAADAKTAGAQATTADVQATIAQKTQRDVIASYAADTLTKQATATRAGVAADVATATKGAQIQKIQVDAAQAAQTLNASWIKAMDDHQVAQQQIAQLQQSIQQSGATFNQTLSENDSKLVMAAVHTGYTGNLDQTQKEALAAYIQGSTQKAVTVQPDGTFNQAGQDFLDNQKQQNVASIQANAQAQGLQNDLMKAGIKLDAQNLKNAVQTFNMRSYDWTHTKEVNAFKDANDINTYLANAVQAGDTSKIDTYLGYLQNSDAYPQQAQLLNQYGITPDSLKKMQKLAQQQFDTNFQTADEKLKYLKGQVGALATQTQSQKTTTLANLAKMVNDPASLDAITSSLGTGDYPWAKADINMFRSFATANIATQDLGTAAKTYTDLQQNSPELTAAGISNWRTAFTAAAHGAGIKNDNVINGIADGLINSWRLGLSKDQLAAKQTDAQIALLGAQKDHYLALTKAQKTSGTTGTDLVKALDAKKTTLKDQQSVIHDQMVANQCIPGTSSPSITGAVGANVAQQMGQTVANPDNPGCGELRDRLQGVSNQMNQISDMENSVLGVDPSLATPPAGSPAPGSAGASASAPAATGGMVQVQTGKGSYLQVSSDVMTGVSQALGSGTSSDAVAQDLVKKGWAKTPKEAQAIIDAAKKQ